MPHRLVVVDGYNILYRAFFGVPALTSPEGVPTNAVYGMANMLLRLMESPETTALVVVFDAPTRTFRHEADQNYKAHRPAMPTDLVVQIPLSQNLVDALGLPTLMVGGFEADDVMGVLASRATAAGWETHIVTGDSDALQLVGPGVQVLAPRKGTDLVTMDEPAVREKYGIAPNMLPDWKALVGDSSDNIAGVPGVGPKTATSLLKQFGSVENLFEHLDQVDNARCRSLLSQSKEQAFRAKHLATIKCDLSLAVDLERWRLARPDPEKVQELFTRLGFRSLLRRLAAAAPAAAASATATTAAGSEQEAAQDYGSVTADGLVDFLNLHRKEGAGPVALCLNDTGTGAPAIAFSPAPGVARVLTPAEVAKARSFLENPPVAICLHDAKSAINALAAAGIRLGAAAADTAILSYLANPGRGHHKLDEVVFESLGIEVQTAPGQPSLFESGVTEEIGNALCQRADCVGQIYAPLAERVKTEGMTEILDRVEMPLIPILAAMEREGIAIDVPLLQALSEELGRQMDALEKEIHQLAGLSFTINSPKQLQEVLFGKLQLASGRTTKTGFSTDAETLKALAQQHPLPAKVLQYREVSKLKSTYADALPRMVNPSTGRVHTSLNQTVTATGRLSSSEPNLQNIPIRTTIGRELRRAFVARPGWQLLSIDYSQIELRILAHVSDDPELMRAFRNHEDVHAHTAASLFNVSVDSVTGEMRRRAKTINFGLMYGMGTFGLATELGISRTEAEAYMDQYFLRFPKVKQYFAETVDKVQRSGYICTLLGRRRYIPEIRSSNRNFRQMGERIAINTPIQGTAADIMKLAMIQVDQAMRAEGLQARMILQVHDELVFELPPEELGVLLPLAKDAMEGAMKLRAPLVVDARIGPNWGAVEAVGGKG